VVVLPNTETPAVSGVDDIGLHLLDARMPLVQPPKPRTDVAVDSKLFDGYVGRYHGG
jgi:serine-type D-Ala-D-Ala carboxypeptidase/endopeptidase